MLDISTNFFWSIMIEKEQKTYSCVTKSNSLIEARYRLSLQEYQVVLWLLTQIRPEDEDFKSHNLDIAEFSNTLGVWPDNRYSELRKTTKHLMQRVMEIHSADDDKTIQIAWLSSAEYQHKKGIVCLEFSPKLKPYLLQLKGNFTILDAADSFKLKSIYSSRIFELLLQYISIGKRIMSVADLRSWCGIEKDEYLLYADLKRKVINRPKKEINEKTKYDISYKEIKESRKVVAIEWTIKQKTHFEKTQSEKEKIITKELRSQHAIIEQMMEYGFSKQGATRSLKNNQESDVVNAIKSVEIQVQRGKARNPKAMLAKAIQEKWHPEIYQRHTSR